MKILIKSSFFLILLMAVVNIGVSDAYAKDASASKTITKINGIDTLLKSSTQFMLSSELVIDKNLQAEANYMDCETSATRLPNGDTYVVTKECRLYVITEEGDVYEIRIPSAN